jgi:hypothetical protein
MSQPNYNAIVFSRRADPSEVEVARAYSLKYGTRIVYLIGDFDSAGDAVSQGSVGGNYIVFDSSPYAVSVGDALATNKVRERPAQHISKQVAAPTTAVF